MGFGKLCPGILKYTKFYLKTTHPTLIDSDSDKGSAKDWD